MFCEEEKMKEGGGWFLSKTMQFRNKLKIINAQDLGFTRHITFP